MVACETPFVVVTRLSASAQLLLEKLTVVCRWKLPRLLAGHVKVSIPAETDVCRGGPDSRNTSAEPVTSLVDVPPATRTVPSPSSVALCEQRATTSLPASVHVPVAGS